MMKLVFSSLLVSCSINFSRALPLRQQPTRSIRLRHMKVAKSDEEWRQLLTPDQFYVLREEGTEQPNSSELNSVKDPGTFVCAGCDAPLFTTSTKYESGTGWPSFYAPIDNVAVATSTDIKLIVPRTEVSCATCSGHLGHVFDDGPQPTGQRFCMNGVAMNFRSDLDYPDLASTVAKRQSLSPYRLDALQILPGVMLNGVIGGLFFNAFVTRLTETGIHTPLDAFPLLPATYFGFLAVQACDRLKLT